MSKASLEGGPDRVAMEDLRAFAEVHPHPAWRDAVLEVADLIGDATSVAFPLLRRELAERDVGQLNRDEVNEGALDGEKVIAFSSFTGIRGFLRCSQEQRAKLVAWGQEARRPRTEEERRAEMEGLDDIGFGD